MRFHLHEPEDGCQQSFGQITQETRPRETDDGKRFSAATSTDQNCTFGLKRQPFAKKEPIEEMRVVLVLYLNFYFHPPFSLLGLPGNR